MLRTPVVSICSLLVGLFFVTLLATLTQSLERSAYGQSLLPNDIIPIYALQGSARESPLAEHWVDTYGVVTGVTATGFYLQDPTGDGDPTSSDGIFVYTRSRPAVQPGACLAVERAFVAEFYEKTELSRAQAPMTVDYCATNRIRPVAIEPPAPGTDPATHFEHVEGMLVQVDDLVGTIQGATKRFGNGDVEVAFLAEPWPDDAPGGRIFQADEKRMAALTYLSGGFGAELPELNWGDRIGLGAAPGPEDAVVGVLDYNFGKYQLIPLPGQAVTGTIVAQQPAGPYVPQPQADEFTLCTTNLWGLGRGTAQLPDVGSYALQLQKRAQAIATALSGCTIIAVQEAGTSADVENLATLLRTRFGLDFAPTALRGPGSLDAEFPLTNGLLTRRDRVEVIAASLMQGCSAVDYEVEPLLNACLPGEYPLFNRPPLVVDLLIAGEWGAPYPVTVINNHWKSKGGDETVNVVRRTAQAAHVASIVQARLAADADARLIVTGDLNDFYGSGPVETLRTSVAPPLLHVYDYLPPLKRYTYIFNGGSQVLDHMLVTQKLAHDIAAVEPVRINADYAYPARTDITTVFHASDHDPVALTLRPAAAAWLSGSLTVPGIAVTLYDAAGGVVGETTTDALGDFRLWRVTPGPYEVAFEAPEAVRVAPARQSLTVQPGSGAVVSATVRHRGADAAAAGVLLLPQWEELSP